jgi:MoaA/NifB/PqqE/SkfB family radical SAM enzyme
MIKPPPDFRKDIAPHRVFFNWEITHECNYKCSYCKFGCSEETKNPTPTVYPGIKKIVQIWHGIYEKYGSCQIHFAGGEPFVYPEFMDLISQLAEFHTLEFSTNFFWDPDDFIKRIQPGRARVGVSLHPESVNFDAFLAKAAKIKQAGFELWVNFVAYPPIMDSIAQYKKKFNEAGIQFFVLLFNGCYSKKKYPESYSPEQKNYLQQFGAGDWLEKSIDFAFDKRKRNIRGKLCRMGQMYSKILPNGDAYVCCAPNALKLGNILDSAFSLLEEPFLCTEADCPCWKHMEIGRETHWFKHWLVPRDAVIC